MTQSHTSPDNERFSVSPDFNHRTHEKAFCSGENNVEQCIAYLNQVCTFKNCTLETGFFKVSCLYLIAFLYIVVCLTWNASTPNML